MKLANSVVRRLLPQQVRMVYGWRNVLEDAVQFEHGVHEIDCCDDPAGKPEYIAVYKLVRVEKAR
jgi:hypothetical protein